MDGSQMVINIDPHVHTEYSSDSKISIGEVINISRTKGLNGVAITDHNSIEGALIIKQNVPDGFVIIVGEEIKTSEGEITGLFLKERVPPGFSSEETIEKIKSQGGLVCITHPFCRFRRSRLKFETLRRIIAVVDIIEIFNSRNIFQADNNRAYTFAKDNKKLIMVGSDAHIPYEYGKSYIRMSPFDNADEFKRSLSSAEFVTQKNPLWVHFVTKWTKMSRNFPYMKPG
jgi:predicted metal-dependent phosphoesterase TrpH